MAHCRAGASAPASDTDVDDEGAERDDHEDVDGDHDVEVDDSSRGVQAALQDSVHVFWGRGRFFGAVEWHCDWREEDLLRKVVYLKCNSVETKVGWGFAQKGLIMFHR